jgi:hypothetical protein
MIVRVTRTGVALEQPEDVRRFHVEVGPGVDDLNRALVAAGFGSVDPSTSEALIPVAALRAAAAGRVSPGWDQEFDAMLGYASSKGWMSDDGTAIKGHVEDAG